MVATMVAQRVAYWAAPTAGSLVALSAAYSADLRAAQTVGQKADSMAVKMVA